MRVTVVTNDFPPRIGGINDYVAQLVRRLPAGSATVFASTYPGAAAFDRTFPQPVIRIATEMMLPAPGVRRQLHDVLRGDRPDVVLFGALWPLGHMGPAVSRKLSIPYGGFSHGLELTGALVPGLLRHIGSRASMLTAVSEWARRKLEPAFGWTGRMQLLPSGIDTGAFHPHVSDSAVRERYGLGDAPVVCCVSRLVARKGQDMLIRALPRLALAAPDARLMIVGSGPYDATLRALARSTGVEGRVIFTGAVPYAELPAHFRTGDVFAMPCRARLGGLDIEALGAVFLQGAAVGRPVLAGRSGGAPEAVKDGVTGLVVDPESPAAIADALAGLLTDRALAQRMGAAGAQWVHTEWSWDAMTSRLQRLLRELPVFSTSRLLQAPF